MNCKAPLGSGAIREVQEFSGQRAVEVGLNDSEPESAAGHLTLRFDRVAADGPNDAAAFVFGD